MRRLNNFKLLLVFISGLLVSFQNAWGNEPLIDQITVPTTEYQATPLAVEINIDRSSRDEDNNMYKPKTVVAGQYGVIDDYKNLGKPADTGC